MNFSDFFNLKDIYFEQIFEPEENALRLLFSPSVTSETPQTITIGEIEFQDTYSIDIDETLPILQIDFETYVGYSIRNESFTSWDDYEEFEGKIFRIYSKSRYLDFIKVSTFASEDYPGPFKHFGIACLNHVVDVVSVSEPIIKEVQRTK
ncbi:hypothetical protein [Paenibacillus antarcticus]|uniref:Uncharacterized protein n=1 Tax=Paenibacillus antarcticus TaxID=253703 RepID=A0A168KQK5_9BACL|nr:hypothetical protein [Paenibacillus antarcticus]OAB42335.1 hypothetical protein PBAT_20260 [Paenibacillus antarcticus]